MTRPGRLRAAAAAILRAPWRHTPTPEQRALADAHLARRARELRPDATGRLPDRLGTRRVRVCASCQAGDHADCLLASPSYVCPCPHTSAGDGRYDLQLRHQRGNR